MIPRRYLILLFLAFTGTKVGALDCQRASSAIEQTLCTQPDLVKLDAEMNKVYERLRPTLTPKARAVVVAQQRAWVADRNRLCANGDAGCLRKEYETRLEYLSALDAASNTSDKPWSDLHPLVVTGSWRATALHDPGGKGSKDSDLPSSLSSAELPAIGELVSTAPGKFCEQGSDCGRIAWKRTTLTKEHGWEAIHRVLGIPEDASVLIGHQGPGMAPLILLVERGHGTVWAIFSLDGRSGESHLAAEEWTPVGPSYTVSNMQ